MDKSKAFFLAERVYENRKKIKNKYSLAPKCKETLEILKSKGYKIAIVSNWNGTLENLLEKLEIRNMFDYIADSSLVGTAKPEAGIFQIALEKTDSKPWETIHVGDMYFSDITGARNAFIYPILLDEIKVLQGVFPCQQINNLWEIVDVLEKFENLAFSKS